MSTVLLDPPGYHQVTRDRRPVSFRNAAGGVETVQNGTVAALPTQTRTASAPAGPRTSQQITADRAAMIAEADSLQTRSATQTLTADEEARYDHCLNEAERLAGELTAATRAERLAAQRTASAQPARPAPTPPTPTAPAQVRSAGGDTADGMQLWFRSFTDEADHSANARHTAQQAGFSIGSTSVRMACDFGGTLNREKRRTISKGGAGTGAEFIPKTYAQKVTEYLTTFSPLVNLVDSETTSDGNDRTYFIVDDTSLISTYITASSGTELAPTIPDNDIATANKVIKAFDITSGYHKLTRQSLRDSAVTLEDKVAKAIGHSHARRIERDIILGTGTTMPDGLVAASSAYSGGAIDDFSQDVFEDIYFSVPEAYRAGCIWLTSSSGMARMRRKLRDSTGRSLLSTAIENGIEVAYLYGCRVVTSSYMASFANSAKPLLFFNPSFYMLRLVAGQSLDVLKEKFYPHLAYASGMAFGGAWLGPSSAIINITLDSSAGSGS